MSSIEELLIDFIKDLKGIDKLSPDESLLRSKLIKSFDFVQLLLFIEEKLDIQFHDDEIKPENFETVSRIMRTINERISR
ncbi:MAG: acyl carrier protein [Deltaproteobacteria bacterium]|nr:acyl carrier protein [Deltaproteobacteria bacterium]MBW2063931.1 acyl carrier protein [Deltaproteobacteria bacterium]